MNSPSMTSRRLGRADFIHLAARPVRLVVDRGTAWVTQDGETEDIEIDAGGQRDFDGHTRLMIGTLGGEAELRLAPLPWPRAAPALPPPVYRSRIDVPYVQGTPPVVYAAPPVYAPQPVYVQSYPYYSYPSVVVGAGWGWQGGWHGHRRY